eukprot:ANDGO_00549.mRNA.1 1
MSTCDSESELVRPRSASPKTVARSRPLPVIEDDAYLAPYEGVFRHLMAQTLRLESEISKNEGSLDAFSFSYKKYGVHFGSNNGNGESMTVREWAPNAVAAAIFGDFNGWSRETHRLERDPFGTFSGSFRGLSIAEHSRLKITFQMKDGSWIDRIPAWMNRCVQEKDQPIYTGLVYFDRVFEWRFPRPQFDKKDLRIYECHVGMSSVEPKISSYLQFATEVLPRVKRLGYNAIQIMAVMEHAYYASFGYQVTNFFAPSSRFGFPHELKQLVDTAHGLGIIVLLDVVHSHASKNVLDGLNQYDGSVDEHYFKGEHPLWDSRLFDYGRYETLRFLLSNLRMWVEEYRFDGFRFDGVTSMLYHHHGMGVGFGDYSTYFGPSLDYSAVVYLMLANKLLHELYPFIVTIAEDVSGLPGLCRTFEDGGIGFDYRLAMSLPDMWEELCSKVRDEDWSMSHICHQLNNRRYKEPNIAYVESHDQALVGSKTIAFWLMDKEMYTHMSKFTDRTPVVDRGIAIHKMARLITQGLGGEGYLTFMGNEFGHPEWIDFPRAGNGESFHHCRRRWDLPADQNLRYGALEAFDAAMNRCEQKCQWLAAPYGFVSCHHDGDKVIVFDRGLRPTVFAFNFHWSQSYQEYRIGVPSLGVYEVVLDTDAPEFDGHSRLDHKVKYSAETFPFGGRPYSMLVYLPCRTGIVFSLVQNGPALLMNGN